MGQESMRADWQQTSALLAVLINSNKVSGPPVPWDAFVPRDEPKADEEIINDPEIKRSVGEAMKKRFRR